MSSGFSTAVLYITRLATVAAVELLNTLFSFSDETLHIGDIYRISYIMISLLMVLGIDNLDIQNEELSQLALFIIRRRLEIFANIIGSSVWHNN